MPDFIRNRSGQSLATTLAPRTRRSGTGQVNELWVGAAEQGDFETIASTVVSSPVASVTFSSIPADYKHLQVRILGRTTRANASATISLRFNGDTGATWSTHDFTGDGATASSGGGGSRTYDYVGVCLGTGSSATADIFGAGITDILDYADTNKYKTIRTLTGKDVNGSTGSVALLSANWRDTDAITTILFTDSSFANLDTGTSIALYGIKG
jgi:hypothetical protein